MLFALKCLTQIYAAQYVTKNVGNVYFFEGKQTINYNLDLNEFYENAEKIEDCSLKLNDIFMKLNSSTQCIEFITTFENKIKTIRSDVNMVRTGKDVIGSKEYQKGENQWPNSEGKV